MCTFSNKHCHKRQLRWNSNAAIYTAPHSPSVTHHLLRLTTTQVVHVNTRNRMGWVTDGGGVDCSIGVPPLHIKEVTISLLGKLLKAMVN